MKICPSFRLQPPTVVPTRLWGFSVSGLPDHIAVAALDEGPCVNWASPLPRVPLVRGHGEDVPDFDRERRLPDLTEVFPVAAGSLIVFTAGNRISTRRPRAVAIRRSIARLWPV